MIEIPPNRIRELREARGLSGEAFGAMVGVNKGAVSGWENRKKELVGSRLHQVAEALMVHVDEIFAARPQTPVNHVADLRQAAGLSQQDLVDRLRWPPAQVRILELATRIPNLQISLKIAEILGCSFTDLIDEPVIAAPRQRAFLDLLNGLNEADQNALFRHGDALTKSSSGGRTGSG